MTANLFLELYLTGKKLRSITRLHNQEKMTKNAILLLLLHEHHTITSLAQRLSLALSTTSEKIHALINDNLLVLTRGQDKRNRFLTLTHQGEQLASHLYQRLNYISAPYTRRYSLDTINSFINLLKDLQHGLQKGSLYVQKNSF